MGKDDVAVNKEDAKGLDMNDVSTTAGPEAVQMILANAKSPEALANYVPSGFSVVPSGVQLLDDKGGVAFTICDALYVVALARDANGKGWGKVLQWKDADGRHHEWALPSSMLAGDGAEYRRILLDQGFNIRAGNKAQNALHDYIATARPIERAISASMPGWHHDRYLALDGKVYGSGKERVLLQTGGQLPVVTKKGSLQDWKDKVARPAVGNSRLVFSISVAFACPLLALAHEKSGGFHFAGESSGGKTTALRVATSVWGVPLRSWRTTDNAAESWARFANDGFLGIDELSQVDSKAADQMAYMLGNGQSKGRANREGIARETSDFRLLFLSTGEVGLAEKVFEGKKHVKAGQAIRMLEIPSDAGKGMKLFENIHGYASGDEFAKFLAVAAAENQGHAYVAWLEAVTSMPYADLSKIVRDLTQKWIKEHVPPGADGQVTRAAGRFALVAVAGELASTFGIVPWQDKEAATAAATCFDAWLVARGGVASHETQEGIRAICEFITAHGNSRFQEIEAGKEDEKVYDRVGWKRQRNGEFEYFVPRDVLKTEILRGSQSYASVLKAAIAVDLIQADTEGKSTVAMRIPHLGQTRLVHITPSKMRGAEG